MTPTRHKLIKVNYKIEQNCNIQEAITQYQKYNDVIQFSRVFNAFFEVNFPLIKPIRAKYIDFIYA